MLNQFYNKTFKPLLEKRNKIFSISIALVIAIFYSFLDINSENIMKLRIITDQSFFPLKILGKIIALPIETNESAVSWLFSYSRSSDQRRGELDSEGKSVVVHVIPKESSRNIQILGITDITFKMLNTSHPLKRKYYADVFQKFKETSNILLVDTSFEDEKKKEESKELVEALKDNKNIILAYTLGNNFSEKEEIQDYEKRLKSLKQYQLKNVIDSKGKDWAAIIHPLDREITKTNPLMGFAMVRQELDFPIRKIPLVVKMPYSIEKKEFSYYPSLDLLTICKYYNIDVTKDVKIKIGEYIKLKNIPEKIVKIYKPEKFGYVDQEILQNRKREIDIPIDSYGQMEINFTAGEYAFEDHDFGTIVKNWSTEQTSELKNTIFLIGMYYAQGRDTTRDIHQSPFGLLAGIEYHAQAINTILNQNFLYHTPKWLNFIIFVLIAVLLGFIQPILKIYQSIFLYLATALTYTIIAFVGFNSFNLIFPFSPIFMGFTIFTILLFQKSLENYKQSIEYQIFEEELKKGRKVQSSLVPEVDKKLDWIEVYGINKPCLQLSGDFFKVYFDKEQVSVIVGDVAGKGAEAALIISATLVMINQEIIQTKEHKKVIEELNQGLSKLISYDRKSQLSLPVTLAYCVIEKKENDTFLHFINAGHAAPIIVRNGKFIDLKNKGDLLGMFDDSEYEVETVSLYEGDFVLFFTDGVWEQRISKEEFFGRERLKEFVAENGKKTPKELIESLILKLQSFSKKKELDDDTTLVGIRII
ncbi:MAG: SpoIIE family protein phosphatase [Leptospiraceae bacterium]|nr:SpoIIE family protein phosphatase [Leptospiraceae bacterium]